MKNRIIYNLPALLFLFAASSIWSQKSFTGKLIYVIEEVGTKDSSPSKVDTLVLYTNDTIVRLESKSKLGNQVLLKHLEKKKSYLLLELMDQKFAIQTNSDTAIVKKNPSLKIKYKLFGGKVLHNLKVKTAVVTRDDLGEPRKILYTKQIRPDLLDVYDGIKGLPVDYYVANPDGVLHYRLVSCTPYKVDRQIFGVPSDYQITTFDNFLKSIRQE